MKKTIGFKNTPISYTVEGVGSAIVLLHGFLEDSTMWLAMKNALLVKNKVVTVDLLGHGGTGCLGYVHTMEEMAEVVKAVLKNEKLRRVKLIGHSMGGYVALAFADKYAANTKGLCLLNSTATNDTAARKEMRLRAIKMAQTNYKTLISMSIDNLFTKAKRKELLIEIIETKKIALNTSVQGYVACSEGMRIRKNREHVLREAAFKKMIILGEKDPVLDFESIKKEAERTKSELVCLPNGHMSYLEDPEELILVVKSFLKN